LARIRFSISPHPFKDEQGSIQARLADLGFQMPAFDPLLS
jgi:hypothetical protein